MIRFTFVVLLFSSLIGCQNSEDKMQSFIKEYNLNTKTITNKIITTVKAETEDKNTIRLLFQTSIDDNESNKSLYKGIFPALIGDLLSQDKAAMELLKEDIRFDIVFLANNHRKLSSVIVDQKKMQAILKNKETKKSEGAEIGKHSKNNDVKLALELMNRNLPITDKTAGTTVIKIDINEANELVYYVEISDKDGNQLKGSKAKLLMKEAMIQAPQIHEVLSSVNSLGVHSLKYIYQNKKGVVFNEIIINQEDLRK